MIRATIPMLALALLVPTTALAHVTVRPAQSKSGGQERYTVRVPTEKPVATTAVQLDVPDGVTVVSVAEVDGAKHEEKKAGARITTIVWTADIQPQESKIFTFTVKNPAAGDKITWKIQQKYADGTVSNWTSSTTFVVGDVDR